MYTQSETSIGGGLWHRLCDISILRHDLLWWIWSTSFSGWGMKKHTPVKLLPSELLNHPEKLPLTIEHGWEIGTFPMGNSSIDWDQRQISPVPCLTTRQKYIEAENWTNINEHPQIINNIIIPFVNEHPGNIMLIGTKKNPLCSADGYRDEVGGEMFVLCRKYCWTLLHYWIFWMLEHALSRSLSISIYLYLHLYICTNT